MACSRRVQKELKEIEKDTTLPICLTFRHDKEKSSIDLTSFPIHLRGIILAPEGSPMKNYILFVHVILTERYPFENPNFYFEHKVWHPKVSIEPRGPDNLPGFVSLHALSRFGWRPSTKLETCLMSIRCLLADPGDRSVVGFLNKVASDQYVSDRAKYTAQSREWTKNSNAGYGSAKFEEYRAKCSHGCCLQLTASGSMMFRADVFSKQEGKYSWKVSLAVSPNLEVYKKRTQHYFKQFKYCQITSFEFNFKSVFDDNIKLVGPEHNISLDECWTITPIGTPTITKESCVGDPRNDPPTLELLLTYRHTKDRQEPTRLIERFKLACDISELYSFDICIDPKTTSDCDITLPLCFKMLLPLAAEWKNIGCLLEISNEELRIIEYNESKRAHDCLRSMLDMWLKRETPTPTWSKLAESVENFDSGLAYTLKNM